MPPRFLQLHYLTSYPAALLNRDDAGFAKRLPFGGTTRTRISSQCLKRHWRTHDGEFALAKIGIPGSVRSRLSFERFVVKPLIEAGIEEVLARAVTEALVSEVLGQSAKAKKAKRDKPKKDESAPEPKTEGADQELQTGQITVLGMPELEFLLAEARAVCAGKPELKQVPGAVEERLGKKGKENLKSLKHAAGLDAALFGRMVTSDILSRGDAAVHVAHAFTVHTEASESDYFSAVDDLLKSSDDETLGSGHIGNTELTSGLFYGYLAVDVPLLVSNLESDSALAAKVVEHLVNLVARVSPGAKLGSTAPYAYAHLVLAETGASQPRSLANAFLAPVRERPDLLANSYASLASHVRDLDRMYGSQTSRQLAGLGDLKDLKDALAVDASVSLTDLASWAANQVRGS